MRFIRTAKVREDGRISEYTFLLLICLILFGLKFINTNYLFIENNTLDLIAVQPVSPEETINHLSAHSSASLLGPSCSGLRTCAEQAQPDFDSPILAVDHIFTIRSAGVNIETKALKHNRALGVLVKGEGVLTVEHVAHGITEISVESQNGELRTPLKVASMDAGSDLLVLALRGMRDCGYEIRSHPLDQGEELRVLVQAENGHSHDLVSSIVYNVASIAAIGDVYLIALPDDRAVSGSPAFDGEGLLVGVVGGTLGSDAKYVIQVRPFTINRDQWVSLADYMGGPQSGMAKIRAMRSRGLEYISLGRLQEARVQLNSVMTLAPSFVIAKANAAAVAIRLGCIREAEKLYAEVSADMPFSPSVWWWLGRCREHIGNLEGAIEAYRGFLSLSDLVSESERVEAQYRLGSTMIAAGRSKEGSAVLSQMAAIPEYADKLQQVCDGLLEQNEYDAVLLIARAMSNGSGGTFAVRALSRQGRLEEATALLRSTRALQGVTIEENLAWTVVLLECEMNEAALERARTGVELSKDDPEGWYLLGWALERNNDFQESATAIRRALEIRPEYFQAWRRLGTVLLKHGDRAGATISLARAFELRPDQSRVVEVLCDLHLQDGDCNSAIAVAMAHAEACNRSVSALLILGDVLILCNQPEEAVRALEEARSREENIEIVLSGLVRALRASGREQDAERVEEELRGLAMSREVDCGELSNPLDDE